jgi:hypothetical protein
MKKFSFLAFFLLGTMLAMAQHSLVTVFADEGERFIVYIDGKQINEEPKSRVAEIKYNVDYTNMKVVFEDKALGSVKTNIPLKDLDNKLQHSVYIIKQNRKGKYKLRLNSTTPYTPVEEEKVEIVYEETSPTKVEITSSENQQVSAKVTSSENPSENVAVSVSATESKDGNKASASFSMSVSTDNNESATVSFNVSEGKSNGASGNASISMNVSGTSTTTETSTSYSESYSSSSSSSSVSISSGSSEAVEKEETQASPPKPQGRCASSTSNSEFAKIVANIKAQDFDDTKLTVAKDIAKNKCLTSAQVHDIMKIFSFEDDRLDFAKYSYEYVYDKDNFYEVYKAFDHSMTVDELKEAIGE